MSKYKFTEVFIPENSSSFYPKKPYKKLIIKELDTAWVLDSINVPQLPKHVTKDTLPHVVQSISNLTVEIVAKCSAKFDDFEKDNYYLDRPLDGLSPDFSDDYKIIEFKTFLRKQNQLSIDDARRKMKEVYSRLNREMTLVFITLGPDFYKTYNVDYKDIEMINSLLGQVYQNWGIAMPKFEDKEGELPTFEEALKYMPWKELLPEEYINMLKNKKFKDLDELDEELMDSVEITEEFVDYNMLDQVDFMSRISEMYRSSEKYTKNIFWDHLWDRDLNREKTSGERGKSTKFGHRSTYLVDYPVFRSSEGNMPIPEVLSILNGLENQFEIKIMKFFKFFIENEGDINSMSELSKKVAFLNSEFKGYVQEKDTDKVTIEKQKKVLADVAKEMKQLKNELNSKFLERKFKITSQGYLVPTGENLDLLRVEAKSKYTRKYSEKEYLGSDKKKDEIDCINWKDDPSTFIEDLTELFSRAPSDYMETFDIEDMYLNNEVLNHNSRNLFNEAKFNLDTILKSETSRFLYGQMKAATANIMNDRRTGQNKGNTDALKINRVRGHNVWILSGIAPNNITSGYTWCMGIHKSNTYKPDYIPKTTSFEFGNLSVWFTGPYRVNRKILNKYEQQYANFISVCLLFNDMNIQIEENHLFCSMYLKYSRELAAIADLVYMAYKNVYSFFTIGKYEFLDKFPSLYFKDPRVAYIFNKLNTEYPRTVEYMRERALSNNLEFKFLDPVFGFPHTSVQSFKSITYLKQIFQKNDGFDEAHKAFEFMKKEKSQQATYKAGPFHHTKWKPTTKKIDEFLTNIFPNGPRTHKWTPSSFYPDACFTVLGKVFDQVISKKPQFLNKNNFRDDLGIDTGANKKVLIPMNKSILSATGETQTRIPGIASSNTTEALVMEELLAREFFIKDAAKSESDPTKIFKNELYKHLNVESLRLKDLVLYEILHFPRNSIVTLVVKEQAGYDKRIFFVQTINKRNLHVLLESAWVKFLEQTEEDMITTPGDEKLVRIERAIHTVSPTSNDYIVLTIDQTRFGDEYHLVCLMFNYVVGLHKGYFTEEQAMLGIFSLFTRMTRLEILPTETMKIAASKEKMREFALRFGENHGLLKYMKENPDMFSKAVYETIFNDKFNERFADVPNLSNLMGLIKEVGFILGVENFGASVMSMCYMWWIKHILNKKGLRDKLLGHTHSDDAYMIFGVRMRKYVNFLKVHLCEVTSKRGNVRMSFLNAFRNATTIVIDNKLYKTTLVVNGRNIRYGNKYFVKFISVLSVILPRFFGQRTSLGKWMCSPQGEVLQAYLINRKVITPLIRYIASLFADLPGKSPTTDLSGLSGRLFNINNHGGTMSLSAGIQIFMNCFIYQRYGVYSKEYVKSGRSKYTNITKVNTTPLSNSERFLYPTELTGYWLSHPSLIFESGFKANEIRLQSNADRDLSIRRSIEVMSRTDDIWSQHSIIELKETHLTEIVQNADSLIEASYKDEETDVAESRTDFQIHITNNWKTNKAFFSLYSQVLPMIDAENAISDMSEQDKKKPGKVVKYLNNKWKIESLLYTKDAVKKFTFFLNRYLSHTFQESYLRVHDAVKVINKLGWLNRVLSWCFSEKFTNFLMDNGISMTPTITVRDVIKLIVKRCRNLDIESLKGAKIRELFKSIYSSDFIQIKGYNRVITSTRPSVTELEYLLTWGVSRTETERNLFSFPFKVLAARLLETSVEMFEKYKDPKNSLFFTKMPQLRYNEAFHDEVRGLEIILNEAGLPTDKIIDHMTLLDRMLKGVVITRIGRFPDISNIADGIESKQRNRLVEVFFTRGSITQTRTMYELSTIFKMSDIFEIFQLLKWYRRIFPNMVLNSQESVYYKGKREIIERLEKDGKNYINNNIVEFKRHLIELDLNLMLVSEEGSPVSMSQRVFYRHYDTRRKIMRLGYKERDYCLLLTVYKSKVQQRTSVSFGIKISVSGWNFILRICSLLTYIFLKKQHQFNRRDIRSSAGNLGFYMNSNQEISVSRSGVSQNEMSLVSTPELESEFQKMNGSFYNKVTSTLTIRMNEITEKISKMNIDKKLLLDPTDLFVIDNWNSRRTMEILQYKKIEINRIFKTDTEWDYKTSVWNSCMIGLAVGMSGRASGFIPVNKNDLNPIMKVCLLSKMSMMTGLTERHLVKLNKILGFYMESDNFYIENESRIEDVLKTIRRPADKDSEDDEEQRVERVNDDGIDLNESKLKYVNWADVIESGENDFNEDPFGEFTEEQMDAMRFEFSKKYLTPDRDKFNVPMFISWPHDILLEVIKKGPEIIDTHIEYLLVCRSLTRERKDEAKLILKSYVASRGGISKRTLLDRFYKIVSPNYYMNFDHPYCSLKFDNKMHINNLVPICNILGHDISQLISRIRTLKACYSTGLTDIMKNVFLANVPNLSKYLHYFYIQQSF